MSKPFFVGQRSLRIHEAARRAPAAGRLRARAGTPSVPACASRNLLIHDGDIAGRVTSVAHSPTLGRTIGLAMASPHSRDAGNCAGDSRQRWRPGAARAWCATPFAGGRMSSRDAAWLAEATARAPRFGIKGPRAAEALEQTRVSPCPRAPTPGAPLRARGSRRLAGTWSAGSEHRVLHRRARRASGIAALEQLDARRLRRRLSGAARRHRLRAGRRCGPTTCWRRSAT